MENNYSYAEFLKAVGKNSSSMQAEKMLNDIYIDLFLSHIHREQTRTRLLEEIDAALDRNDKPTFMQLTDSLRTVDEKE
ncbi:IDEAL domain-containing protein [Sporosarcina sp. BI001-red]|uniref:IDEAL domain-containing protein n=1 Tax=Sporosarcina sp. BI001-red TaxID=2282866 RepID=UPI000E288D80|nr:IDEAL domain-containing protein [Sporosarcina sp. BI001-red]REB04729.1 IDEAL domain-containing protein [Sporosarcina sp. BI001-red]